LRGVAITMQRSQVLASGSENQPTVIADAPLFGVRQPHDQNTGMLARLELPRVCEVQIVCNE